MSCNVKAWFILIMHTFGFYNTLQDMFNGIILGQYICLNLCNVSVARFGDTSKTRIRRKLIKGYHQKLIMLNSLVILEKEITTST